MCLGAVDLFTCMSAMSSREYLVSVTMIAMFMVKPLTLCKLEQSLFCQLGFKHMHASMCLQVPV